MWTFWDKLRKKDSKLFFRGHSKVSYDLKPSLFRKEEWLSNEKKNVFRINGEMSI